jgi:hypothetical protein
MPEINFNILQPVDVGALTQQGFSTGMAMVKQVQTKNALRAYLDNPDDPQAYNALAAFDPVAAATIQTQQMSRRKMALETAQLNARRAAGTQAAGGDVQGGMATALTAGDTDFADALSKLDDNKKKQAADFWSKAGPVAYQLKQTRDPAARQALWAQAKPILAQTGADPALLEKFDPTNDAQLEAAIVTSQKVSDLIDQGKIVWHQQGEQPSFATDSLGRPIGTQNPYAGGGAAPAPTPPGSGGSGSSRGLRNNNPLNLTESEFTRAQPGFAGTDSGGQYAKFETPEAGMAAGQHLLGSYLERGFDTPAEIIERWAPAKENGAATANYVNYVAKRLGVGPHDPVTAEQVPALMQAMTEFENGGRSGGHEHAMSVGAAPHVSTKAEYDKLQSGTPFVAPDGSHRVKP